VLKNPQQPNSQKLFKSQNPNKNMKKKAKRAYSRAEIKHRSKALIGIGSIELLMAAVSGSIGMTGYAISNTTQSEIYSLSVGMILVSLIALYIGSKYSDS
jgi:hypothetical protein